MTRGRLLLLTASFPFGVGEEFIEDELPYLARRFERLTIVPMRASGHVRPVPEHVRVEPGLSVYLARRTLTPLHASDARMLARELWQQRARSLHPRALWRALRYVLRAHQIHQWLARAVDRSEPTLCYAYWLGPGALAACWLRAQHPGLRVVARGHGADLYRERHQPPYIPMQRTLLCALDRAYAISRHGLDYMTRLAPEGSSHYRLSRLGVPVPSGTCLPSSDGTLRILSCSNTAPVKRLERIVSGLYAFSERARAQRIHWCHLGGGPGHAAFARHATSRLAGRVTCELPGHGPRRSIAAYYASHAVDGFINVSASEGLPVSIMEAQSYGVPVIATAVGGTPELVNEDTGWLLPADPTDAQIATALLALCQSDTEAIVRKRASAEASWRQRVSAAENYPRFAGELEGLLEQLHPGPPRAD